MSEVRADLANRIVTRLAGRIIDLEMDIEDIEECIRTTVDKFRQRSSNGVEEGFTFLELQNDKQEYILPEQVTEVREIFRQGLGKTQGGVTFDPFSAAFTNFFLLEAGRQGGLHTFALFTQYQETIGTLFGEHIMFIWDPNKHKLTIIRQMRDFETVMLWVYFSKTDDEIINDIYARSWVIDYATAVGKSIVGEGRAKFSQIIGPQGGTTLNGDQLKNEGLQEMERLENEIMEYGSGEEPLGFLIG